MSGKQVESIQVNCGCFSFIILIAAILVLWALWFGLPTSWGKLNIDIFPPGVYLEKP